MTKLSVIIPFANEYPQVIFTIRAIAEELRDRVDFEIIAVDNYCQELHEQKKNIKIRRNDEELEEVESKQYPDRGGEVIEGSQKACTPWLKHIKYSKKLSHWNAKNAGIREAKGDFYYFVDAHVMPSQNSISQMFSYYEKHWQELNGTIALPLTYKILENRRLIYKLFLEDDGTVHYKFTPQRKNDEVFQVPCMSACGVMMHKSIMDGLGGGWPERLGIYGGGENFLNFVLATQGRSVNIYPFGTLYHHGDPREYYWNWTDYTRNRAVANYMIGGEPYMEQFLDKRKGDRAGLNRIRIEVLESCKDHKEKIQATQKIPIQVWLENCKERGWLD